MISLSLFVHSKIKVAINKIRKIEIILYEIIAFEE